MAFTINDRAGQEAFAQGGIYMECLMLTYDAGLAINQKLRISPALWDSQFISPNITDKSYYWEIAYPNVVGTFPATLINADKKYKNMQVKVRFFSNKVFEVIIEYLALADTHKFLYPYIFQPLNLWTKQSVDNSHINVYTSAGRQIGLTVILRNVGDTADLLRVDSEKAAQGKEWTIVNYPSIDNRYYLESNGIPVNGFVPGEDLKIKLRNFPEHTNCQYFCGIFRTDELLNQGEEFYDELYMQYALSNNTADEPFKLATNTIARTKLQNVHGFRYDHFESIADFEIHKSYFELPGRYRVFCIVKENCQFRSYLFDEFKVHTNREAPVGTIDIINVKVDGVAITTTDGTCMYDVPYCAEVEYLARMNIASFNADLLAKGYPGTFFDYFVGVDAYISDGINQLGLPVDGQSVTDNGGATGYFNILYKFMIPENWQGLAKYPNFVWKFDYGSIQDYITAFTQIQIHTGSQLDIVPVGVGFPETICDVDYPNYGLCFQGPSSASKFFFDLLLEGVKIDKGDLIYGAETDFSTDTNADTINDACLTFIGPLAKNELQYCLKMRAFDPQYGAGAAPCTDIEISRLHVPGPLELFTFDFELIGWADADVKAVFIDISNTNHQILGTLKIYNKAKSEQIFLPHEKTSPYILTIYILRSDGFSYYLADRVFNWSKDVDINKAKFNICSTAGFQDCPENPILSHTVTWNYFAPPPPYGSIQNKTITAIFTNPGAPTSQAKTYTVNGGAPINYTVPFTVNRFDKVILYWSLTYSPTCTIKLEDCITDEECSAP